MTGPLFFFSALGAFNGFVLSLYLFFFTKEKTVSKYFLASLVFVLSIRIGKSVLMHFNPELPRIYLQVGLSGCFFIGPFLYLYLKSELQKTKNLWPTWRWILLGFLAFILVGGAVRPYSAYPDFWNEVFIFIIYYQWLAFMVASIFLMFPICRKAINSNLRPAWPADRLSSNERWLLAIFSANFLIFFNYFIVLHGLHGTYYMAGPLVFSFFLYLAIFGFFYTDKKEFSEQKSIKKYANKKIEAQDADPLITQLEQLMTEEKLYTNSKLKLKAVAEKLDIPTHRLSQLLNDNLGKSFSKYINEHRVKAACQLLGTANNLSLEGIGYEVGFHSKSTFFTTFKKVTGLTPANYQQQKTAKST